MEKKTILVTGGLGYIGKNITNLLLKNNFKVIVIDNLENSFKHKFKENNYDFIKIDILDLNKLNNVFQENKIDIIIHTAGMTKVNESEKKPLKYFDVNVSGTINILKMMEKFKIKFLIFSSSAAVYGNPKRIPIKEDDLKNPINVYGLTKLIDEKMIIKSEIYGIKSIIFRYFNVAGKNTENNLFYNPRGDVTHLFPSIKEVINNKKEKLIIYGNNYNTKDKTCIRDYIHIDDLAYAHLLAINYLFKYQKSEIFNLGSKNKYSNLEIVKLAEKVIKNKINYVISENKRKGDPDILFANTKNIEKKLKFYPKKNIINVLTDELN
ncbi:/ galE / UDP-glucose 4-epimerase /:438419 Forward [Candidatus Hepatoplasma crinochetorum]|uniref:UDP-glucose 4-epimerase n=1 Tax=Candidatus Hepatoplasma crinochetorum TaxID=295596 RepID=A0A0G7ZN66_9MOLU|nr:/ galE / UDP-glucose 4-epimerase /:438419 Forward [Candidatus Hepatoplasma crinochetorum]